MALEKSLGIKFAKAITDTSKEATSSKNTSFMATVTQVTDTDILIKIDGSSIDTPAQTTMDVEVGDRVIAKIENHIALITGNITNPATYKYGSKYVNMTEEGLAIGDTESNYRTITSDNDYRIQSRVNTDWVDSAIFSDDGINFRNGSDAEIVLAENRARILYSYDDITNTSSTELRGIITPERLTGVVTNVTTNSVIINPYPYQDQNEPIEVTHFKFIKPSDFEIGDILAYALDHDYDIGDYIVATDNLTKTGNIDFASVALRIGTGEKAYDYEVLNGSAQIECNMDKNGRNPIVSIRATPGTTPDGVNLFGSASIDIGDSAHNIRMHSPSNIAITTENESFTHNDSEVITANMFKTIAYSFSSTSIPSSNYYTFEHKLTSSELPEGYAVIGFVGITTNHKSYAQLTSFSVSDDNYLRVSIYNRTSSSLSVSVNVKLLAAKIK